MKVTRIALTGAPCSGKTSIINELEKLYKKENKNIFVCPEAATNVISLGFNRDDYLSFETQVAKEQIRLEKEIEEKISSQKSDAIILYDRPLTDCFSYVDDVEKLEKKIGENIVSAWARYDAIIMLEICDKSDYQTSIDRVETYEDSLLCQENILKINLGHSHFRFIKSTNSLSEKINNTKSEIDSILSGLEIEKKFLIEYPKFEELEKYSPFKVNISQTYLLSSVGSHRVRKRGYNGNYSYIETLKIRVNGSVSEESENIISKEEYETLLKNADPNKHEIKKDRYCFLYDGQFFELDIFPFWSDKAFLELELKSLDSPYTLPPEIKVIKDVSNDKRYKNNYLAGLDL